MPAALEAVAWDLDPLVDGEGEAGADRQLAEAQERSAAFADRYQGKLATIEGEGIAEAGTELQAISGLVGKAGTYAVRGRATNTADPSNGALLQRVQELATAVETKLVFFDL